MNEPLFLSVDNVEYLHRESIARYGGTLGVRDRAGLEAAVNHPINVFHYGQGDVFDIAAAYAYPIAQAQAFLDGNNRTAIAAALNFLNLNGCKAIFDPQVLYEAMIGIAERRITKRQFATSLRQQARS